MVADLVDRLEKMFFWFRWCHGDTLDELYAARERNDLQGEISIERLRNCSRTSATLLGGDSWFLEANKVAGHLFHLKIHLASRLLVFHTDHMARNPRLFFARLSRRLGTTQPFSPGHIFKKFNSRPGHRTDLCKLPKLVRALKRKLSPDYETVETLLRDSRVDVPNGFALRQTRCDSIEKLNAAPLQCQFQPGAAYDKAEVRLATKVVKRETLHQTPCSY